MQLLSASVLSSNDVVVISSSSGRLPELLEVAEKARERGAKVIAIAASHSPLVRKTDVALIVDHVEDVTTHLPMVSRVLHLLVIDMLAVGVLCVVIRKTNGVMPVKLMNASTKPAQHHGRRQHAIKRRV